MFTTIDKAIAGAVMAIITILTSFGVAVPEFVNETYVSGVVALLIPFVVWIIPNKPKDTIKGTAGKQLAMLLPLLFLGGCAAIPGYADIDVDNTHDAIVLANAELRATNLLLQNLIETEMLTTSEAQQALDSLQDAHDTLQKALTAIKVNGDPVTAESHRARALRSISLVMQLLAPSVGEPST